jgi:hypothetical protein
MAIFSEKVISAKFIDPPNNMLVEVLYREGDVTVPYVLEVDFTQQDFKELLKEISLNEIESITIKEQELKYNAFNRIIEAEVNRRWQLESEKVKKAYDEVDQYAGTMKSDLAKEYRDQFMSPSNFSIDNITSKEIFNHIIKKNEDKDFVFDLKVGILEDADITKSKDKDLKLAIRKAKSVFELIKLYEEAKGIS